MCMMEAKQNLTKISVENASDDKSNPHDPLLMPESDAGPAGSLTEVTICSEQLLTEDTEVSSTDVSVNASADQTSDVPVKPKAGWTRAASVELNQPKPLHTLLSPSTQMGTIHQDSQSFMSASKSGASLKKATQTDQEDPSSPSDLCAAVLLGCLFCHPLDCLLAAVRGLHLCSLSLCSWLCGCEPATLQPLLDATYHCNVCGCLGARCIMCDCPICDICLQATECLDLAMEISQMLYH